MSKENGFVPLRRGIWEHVRDGRMSKLEALAFIYICSQADTRTGIWKGSAGALAGELGLPPRTGRDVLEKMEHGDYIRRLAVPGQHLCYPILVHKFPISQGEHNGEQLDALSSSKSDGCLEVRYFSREHSVEQHGEHSVEHGAAQRRIENRNKRSKKAAKPPDPRFGAFLEFAKSSFEAKHKHPPTWDCFGKDGSALTAFLQRAPHVTLDLWQTRILNYWDSSEPFTVKQGGSLSYFISRFDTFASGPIMATPQRGGSNGKPGINEAIEQTLSAHARREQSFTN